MPISWPVLIVAQIFHGQLLLSQAAELDRPPTQLEVEAELMTSGKSGRPHLSSSWGGVSDGQGRQRGLAAFWSKVEAWQQNVKGELEDMKNSVKELLCEVRKQRPYITLQECSEVRNTGLEEAPRQEAEPVEEVVAVMDLVHGKSVDAANAKEKGIMNVA